MNNGWRTTVQYNGSYKNPTTVTSARCAQRQPADQLLRRATTRPPGRDAGEPRDHLPDLRRQPDQADAPADLLAQALCDTGFAQLPRWRDLPAGRPGHDAPAAEDPGLDAEPLRGRAGLGLVQGRLARLGLGDGLVDGGEHPGGAALEVPGGAISVTIRSASSAKRGRTPLAESDGRSRVAAADDGRDRAGSSRRGARRASRPGAGRRPRRRGRSARRARR